MSNADHGPDDHDRRYTTRTRSGIAPSVKRLVASTHPAVREVGLRVGLLVAMAAALVVVRLLVAQS